VFNVSWIMGEFGGRGLRSADAGDRTIHGLHAAPRAALGFVLHGYAELPSTNDEAHRLAEAGAPHGTVVHATRQTAGCGRQRRTWLSPEGNLHASFLLRPGIPARPAHEIGFVAAVAVSDTVDPLLPKGTGPR